MGMNLFSRYSVVSIVSCCRLDIERFKNDTVILQLTSDCQSDLSSYDYFLGLVPEDNIKITDYLVQETFDQECNDVARNNDCCIQYRFQITDLPKDVIPQITIRADSSDDSCHDHIFQQEGSKSTFPATNLNFTLDGDRDSEGNVNAESV